MSRRTGSRRTAAVRRVVPIDVWHDGKLQAFLAEIGLSPDDDRHVFLSNDQIERRWIAEHENVCAAAAEATGRLPCEFGGAEVRPYYLLHRGLWIGREHFFFNWLQLWPSRYCVQLPTSDAAAVALATFRCPEVHDRGHMERAAHVLDALAIELQRMSERIRTLDLLRADRCQEPELQSCLAETTALKEHHLARVAALAEEFLADHKARWATHIPAIG